MRLSHPESTPEPMPKLAPKAKPKKVAAPKRLGARAVVLTAIERTPGVCGGDACVSGTRIPVWVLEQARQLGMRHLEILEEYPSITWAQLLSAWQFAEDHRAEIEAQIFANEYVSQYVDPRHMKNRRRTCRARSWN
jgi:uncharacterized protein (DUF433 family)